MQVNPKLLKQKFEKSMPKYNENAVVQREMAEKLVHSIKINEFSHILELGSGTGILTELIVQNFKFEHLTCNDIVEKSKFYLDKIAGKYDFIVGNSSRIKPSRPVDLIISNAMFQWFSTLPLEYYYSILSGGGILAFSTFSEKNFKEIREALGVSLNYLTVEKIRSAAKEKFEILEIFEYERVLEFSTPLELLAHLKNTGVNSLNSKKMTFQEVKDFCGKISTTEGRCYLTYSPVIVVLKKGLNRERV